MRSHIPRSIAVARAAAALLVTLAYGGARAESPEDKGLRIARQVDRANEGWKTESSSMEMVLINAHGDRTTRKMRSQILEGDSDGDRSRIEFEWPADVKGTRMLTWSHKTQDDDQWLFLPAVKRVKRISSKNKAGSFMGSEFSYEDLGSQEIEKFKHKFLGEEALDGRAQWRIERIPVNPDSGYSRQVVWIDQEYQGASKIEYYDRKGELLKTATFSGYQRYGKLWRLTRIEVMNHQTKKASVLTWSERKLGEKLDRQLFEADELDD